MPQHSWVGEDVQRSTMLKSEGLGSRSKIFENFLSMNL